MILSIHWNIISKHVKADLKSRCYQHGVLIKAMAVEVPADFRSYVEKLARGKWCYHLQL